jgi:hypothetical protein
MAPRSASEKVRPKKSYFSSACEYVKLLFTTLLKLLLHIFVVDFLNKFHFIIVLDCHSTHLNGRNDILKQSWLTFISSHDIFKKLDSIFLLHISFILVFFIVHSFHIS